MTTQQKFDSYEISKQMGNDLYRKKKANEKRIEEIIKLFIDITFIAALAFVGIQVLRLEQDYITPVQALVTGLLACTYMLVAVITYKNLEEGGLICKSYSRLIKIILFRLCKILRQCKIWLIRLLQNQKYGK